MSARELRAMNAARRLNSQAAPQGLPFERLEPYDGKLSHTVLRGKGAVMPLTYPVDKITI